MLGLNTYPLKRQKVMDKTQRKIMVGESPYIAISPSSVARTAVKMDIDPIVALRMRYRYLKEYAEDMKSVYLKEKTIDPYFWWWVDAAMQVQSLVDFAKQYKHNKPKLLKNMITDFMIQNAAKYPIPQLVEIVHGRTTAFCHDDKNPSAYYGSRVNRLFCPVCAKSFNPINILMERDGMSFPSAVLFLQ